MYGTSSWLGHYFLSHVLSIFIVEIPQVFLLFTKVLCFWFCSTSPQGLQKYVSAKSYMLHLLKGIFDHWSEKMVIYSWCFSCFSIDLVPCITSIHDDTKNRTLVFRLMFWFCSNLQCCVKLLLCSISISSVLTSKAFSYHR